MSKKRATKAERKHMDRVTALGCIVCTQLGYSDSPAGIHHIRAGQGTGQRADHYHTIPLCPIHHQTGGYGVAYHAGPQVWENNFGTESELLVQVMYELEGKKYA
ncbi:MULTISPECIES: Ref family recombination enhancement nuclease [Lelliottia]|uniref:DUF968 domain-containing protein n=1 Tax=Lelliottia aquatilis TaxID=2080838 RepID=A0ABX5A463_9ENTR|nr:MULTISPECIES: Ref family recombination enhancement nuclease [Lelliottia]POZ14099.1 hypothetical protein C3Z09_20190 [Lelliottia aquatilis]POZ24001.1 hypothetical protein C3712_07195 [Lelliottia aquatilis]POZ27597.1 hypothetical protein C3708_08460 [Lelliottia sp. 7254-16]POZ29866.1 hypothetical protein C3711_01670 [Lelliottia aquatilis]POZ35431.1 hypothetical protein C3710_01670 [Lelliottia aquatilis]